MKCRLALLTLMSLIPWAVPGTLTAQDRRFSLGVCTHFSQGKGVIGLNLNSIKVAGITAIRDEATWGTIEYAQGQYRIPEHIDRYVRMAAAQGLEIMMILDYANRFYDNGDRPRSPEAVEGFCRYAAFMVRHFGRDIRLYEVWNEWDIGIGLPDPYRQGGSAEDYVRLLKAVYPRLKAITPEITVIAGACTSGGVHKGWLDSIVAHGALDFSDAISIHAYNYSKPFPQRSPEACMTWIAAIQARLRKKNGDRDVPFYVTEMGWPNHVGKRGTAPELSASYLARLYLLARTAPSFRGLWWYDFQDDGWNPEHNEDNFGMVRPDLTPKPHYPVTAALADLVTQGRYRDTLETEDPNLRVLRFTLSGKETWALWSSDDRQRQVLLQTPDPSRPLAVQPLGGPARVLPWGFRAWTTRGEYRPDQCSVVLGHRPILLSGHLEGVTVIRAIDRARAADYAYP